jgi:Integrase core domain
VTAHVRVTGPIVLAEFPQAVAAHGIPASTLTDNGMVYTTRFSGGKGGRNAFEAELRRLAVVQKNSRPNHPTTCGKVEPFQQTLKKWLTPQPVQPATIDQLQVLLDAFVAAYNHHRPHRSLPHRATPATIHAARPKATPRAGRDADTHDRIRRDRVDATGVVTLRHAGRLRHIGIGRTHARTHVLLLVQEAYGLLPARFTRPLGYVADSLALRFVVFGVAGRRPARGRLDAAGRRRHGTVPRPRDC